MREFPIILLCDDPDLEMVVTTNRLVWRPLYRLAETRTGWTAEAELHAAFERCLSNLRERFLHRSEGAGDAPDGMNAAPEAGATIDGSDDAGVLLGRAQAREQGT